MQVGYLVTLHLFPGDDLPQRLFADRESAREFAQTVPVEELVSTFGYCISGREIEEHAFSITEFDGGVPVAVEKVGREDYPREMDATRDLDGVAMAPVFG
jgi:hypothetical protein